MAKKEKQFKINMSMNDFISTVIDNDSEVQSLKDKEIIIDKKGNRITLKKKISQ